MPSSRKTFLLVRVTPTDALAPLLMPHFFCLHWPDVCCFLCPGLSTINENWSQLNFNETHFDHLMHVVIFAVWSATYTPFLSIPTRILKSITIFKGDITSNNISVAHFIDLLHLLHWSLSVYNKQIFCQISYFLLNFWWCVFVWSIWL